MSLIIAHVHYIMCIKNDKVHNAVIAVVLTKSEVAKKKGTNSDTASA